MASFKVVEPSIDKLTDLARISYQMRWYEKRFKSYKDPADEREAIKYKEELDAWHKKNLELVTGK